MVLLFTFAAIVQCVRVLLLSRAADSKKLIKVVLIQMFLLRLLGCTSKSRIWKHAISMRWLAIPNYAPHNVGSSMKKWIIIKVKILALVTWSYRPSNHIDNWTENGERILSTQFNLF
jgi:hypothetical protein